jgi:hypothetical protein
MSAYLEGLVARSAGAAPSGPGVPRLRRLPRFQSPGLTFDAAGAADRGPEETTQPAERTRELAPVSRPTDPPRPQRRAADTPPEAHVVAAAIRTPAGEAARARPAPSSDPAHKADRPAASHPQAHAPPQPLLTPPAAVDERPSVEADPVPARAHAELRIRPTSPMPALGVPQSETEPPIEVHIGRVEITRPGPPPRPGRTPAPARRVPRGFNDLAASRRYVDRLPR